MIEKDIAILRLQMAATLIREGCSTEGPEYLADESRSKVRTACALGAAALIAGCNIVDADLPTDTQGVGPAETVVSDAATRVMGAPDELINVGTTWELTTIDELEGFADDCETVMNWLIDN